MEANRYLGVLCALPTRTKHLGEYPRITEFDTREIERYAFPGGYEIVLLFGDYEELCVPCANKLLREREAEIGRLILSGEFETSDYVLRSSRRFYEDGSMESLAYSREETIVSLFTMADTDSCAHCVECSRYVLSSGCGFTTDEDGRETEEEGYAEGHVRNHAEHCRYYVSPAEQAEMDEARGKVS